MEEKIVLFKDLDKELSVLDDYCDLHEFELVQNKDRFSLDDKQLCWDSIKGDLRTVIMGAVDRCFAYFNDEYCFDLLSQEEIYVLNIFIKLRYIANKYNFSDSYKMINMEIIQIIKEVEEI